MSIKDRIRRLEDRNGSVYPECYRKPTVPRFFYPEEGEPEPQSEYCPRCDRPLTAIIRVMYEEEGEGGHSRCANAAE